MMVLLERTVLQGHISLDLGSWVLQVCGENPFPSQVRKPETWSSNTAEWHYSILINRVKNFVQKHTWETQLFTAASTSQSKRNIIRPHCICIAYRCSLLLICYWHVAWSVCACVSVYDVMGRYPAKTAGLIEMPFGMWGGVGHRNHVLDGGLDPQEKGQFWDGEGAVP